MIGLGTGTLATYSRAGDDYLFYDINPLVADMARTRFTYLADAKGAVALAMGDARVSLQQQAPQGFDVLVVDAFSGDSIPVHLLTAQAFADYFRHLKPEYAAMPATRLWTDDYGSVLTVMRALRRD